jgi:hypothetical protein
MAANKKIERVCSTAAKHRVLQTLIHAQVGHAMHRAFTEVIAYHYGKVA